MTFTEVLKEKWRYGGWAVKIITINVIVFLFINLILNIDEAFLLRQQGSGYSSWVRTLFVLPDDFLTIAKRPWTILTHMFAHEGFFHLAFNMLWFYYGAQLFRQFLGDKRLIYVYILGGIAGALAQVLATNFIPWFQTSIYSGLIGASGAVYAVFIAVAFYRPMTPIMLFGLFQVRLVYIAMFLVISDFVRLTSLTNVSHMAHLGGALFGILAIAQLGVFDRLINRIDRFFWIFSGGFSKMRSRLFLRSKPQPKAQHYHKADERYFETKKEVQDKIDAILDKIKHKGYDGLSKAEKDYLFTHKDRL
jgi:membrane associated rhomboid family serine protease